LTPAIGAGVGFGAGGAVGAGGRVGIAVGAGGRVGFGVGAFVGVGGSTFVGAMVGLVVTCVGFGVGLVAFLCTIVEELFGDTVVVLPVFPEVVPTL
jgi:hypothetical protein